MKYFNSVFDAFLYESLCFLFFGSLLYVLNDPIAGLLFTLSVYLAGITILLGFAGRFFCLFTRERDEEY
jgi:hypothetical protein